MAQPMMVRLRGAVRQEIPWTPDLRVPQIAEQFQFNGAWYRVSNVAWAYLIDEGTVKGWDVGIWLSESNPPPGVSNGQRQDDEH